jgi:N-acetylmuramic acid 6-phosphate etherase
MEREHAPTPALTLEAFLADADQFRLGHLPTEQPHPKTSRLAEWSRGDLRRALAVLREVDHDALFVLAEHAEAVQRLGSVMRATLDGGGRVFLCGCGATGRLALSLETLWRQCHAGTGLAERVVSFMAGGDTALISSIEGFEDHPELGARHLRYLGFGARDLLVSCTEGGETAWVIGATLEAARVSHAAPWFWYCNPPEALRGLERSEQVLTDPGVVDVSLATGPMALSGSTRMQASTVLMLAVGLALLQPEDGPRERLGLLGEALDRADAAAQARLIESESALYRSGAYVLYGAGRHAITVLTDTTERAPTFNLASFENSRDPAPEPSLCYLVIDGAAHVQAAWEALLGRAPRPLDWPGFEAVAGWERLLGFDFSRALPERRRRLLDGAVHERFEVARVGEAVTMSLRSERLAAALDGLSLLEEHVLLKLLLNAHSTLVMGRLGRYESNVMTWVRPSNRKLIDRAIRYVEQLLRVEGRAPPSYPELARALFREMEALGSDESIVLKTYGALTRV